MRVQFGLLLRLDCRIPSLLQVKTLLSCSNAAHAVLCSRSDQNTLSYTNYSVFNMSCFGGCERRSCCHKITYLMIFLPFSFIEPFRTKGRMRLIPNLNRTANSLISISNDRPNNHTYKNLCLNELAKFLRHHRCLYVVRAMA